MSKRETIGKVCLNKKEFVSTSKPFVLLHMDFFGHS